MKTWLAVCLVCLFAVGLVPKAKADIGFVVVYGRHRTWRLSAIDRYDASRRGILLIYREAVEDAEEDLRQDLSDPYLDEEAAYRRYDRAIAEAEWQRDRALDRLSDRETFDLLWVWGYEDDHYCLRLHPCRYDYFERYRPPAVYFERHRPRPIIVRDRYDRNRFDFNRPDCTRYDTYRDRRDSTRPTLPPPSGRRDPQRTIDPPTYYNRGRTVDPSTPHRDNSAGGIFNRSSEGRTRDSYGDRQRTRDSGSRGDDSRPQRRR